MELLSILPTFVYFSCSVLHVRQSSEQDCVALIPHFHTHARKYRVAMNAWRQGEYNRSNHSPAPALGTRLGVGRPDTVHTCWQTPQRGCGGSSPGGGCSPSPGCRCSAAAPSPSPGRNAAPACRRWVWCSAQNAADPPPSWTAGPSGSTADTRKQASSSAETSLNVWFHSFSLGERVEL